MGGGHFMGGPRFAGGSHFVGANRFVGGGRFARFDGGRFARFDGRRFAHDGFFRRQAFFHRGAFFRRQAFFHHRRFFRRNFFAFGFFPGAYASYDDYGCWQWHRVWRPYGWRWRQVNVCYGPYAAAY